MTLLEGPTFEFDFGVDTMNKNDPDVIVKGYVNDPSASYDKMIPFEVVKNVRSLGLEAIGDKYYVSLYFTQWSERITVELSKTEWNRLAKLRAVNFTSSKEDELEECEILEEFE